jgi:FkbM family methyltransferase
MNDVAGDRERAPRLLRRRNDVDRCSVAVRCHPLLTSDQARESSVRMRAISAIERRAKRAARLAGLGLTFESKARIYWLVLVTPLLRRLRLSLFVPIRMKLGRQPATFIVTSDSDLLAVYEVFRLNEYSVRGLSEPHLILDLGSHIGASILHFRQAFPNATIVGAEPDPVNFKKLTRNVGQLPNVRVLNVAVGATSGRIPFYASGALDGWASSSTPGGRWQREIAVECLTLADLLARAQVGPPDLLKIDVEGAEFQVLSAYEDLPKVTTILGEVHPTLMNESVDSFLRLLAHFDCDLDRETQAHRAFRAVRRSAQRST